MSTISRRKHEKRGCGSTMQKLAILVKGREERMRVLIFTMCGSCSCGQIKLTNTFHQLRLAGTFTSCPNLSAEIDSLRNALMGFGCGCHSSSRGESAIYDLRCDSKRENITSAAMLGRRKVLSDTSKSWDYVNLHASIHAEQSNLFALHEPRYVNIAGYVLDCYAQLKYLSIRFTFIIVKNKSSK